MTISFKELSQHIKQKEEIFNLVNTVSYNHKDITYNPETYTLTKLNSKVERNLINLYTGENTKITVTDILASAIVKIDNKDVSRNHAIDFINNLEKRELELLFYNLRIMNYGNQLNYSYECEGETVAKLPNGRVERDVDGTVIMKKCEHTNQVSITLDGVDEIDSSIDEVAEFLLKDYIDIDIDVKIFVKKVSGKEKDSKLYRSISDASKKKYGYLFDFIVTLDRIEIKTDDDVDIKKYSISDFFTSKGIFSVDSQKIQDFRYLYDNILDVAIIRDIKNKSTELAKDDAYISIVFEHKCSKCGFLNTGKVGVYHPSFLLPMSAE